ncbi:MAG: helix-turn-helix domain-containing protein [Natronospirillum sp.]
MTEPELGLHIRSYSEEGQKHSHNHHQLVLPLTGKLSLSIENVDGGVEHNKAAIIPSGSDHAYSASDENRFLVADVPEGLAPALERLPLFVELDRALLHYVQFLHHQVQQGGASFRSEHQMLLLLIQLLQERHGTRLNLDRRVAAAKHYVDEHFHQKITVAHLSAVAHLSTRQLNELFRHQIGMTPHQYLTELRMREAWRLLEQSDLSIQRIADAVGYSSLSTFSDRFAQHFRKSPSYFRRNPK